MTWLLPVSHWCPLPIMICETHCVALMVSCCHGCLLGSAPARTEKEPGMFATLVVQLPVQGGHTGGSLEVRGPTGTKYVWETGKVRVREGGVQRVKG
jgi:hypothetical protein